MGVGSTGLKITSNAFVIVVSDTPQDGLLAVVTQVFADPRGLIKAKISGRNLGVAA